MRTRLAAAAALAVFLVSPLAVSTATAMPHSGGPVGPVADSHAGGYGFPGDWCEAFPWWPSCR